MGHIIRPLAGLRARRRSVVWQVVAAGASGLALIAIMLVALLSAVSDQQRMTNEIEHSARVLVVEHVAERRVLDLESGLRGYSATGHRVFLQEYWTAQAKLPGQLVQLHELVRDDPEQAAQVAMLSRDVGSYIADYSDPFIALGLPLRGRALFLMTLRGKFLVDGLRARFQRVERNQFAVQARLDARASHSGRRLRTLGIAAAAAILLGLLAFVSWVTRAIAAPLRRGGRALGRLSAGERGLRLAERGCAEERLFARAFNDAAAQLAERESQLHYLAEHDPQTGLHNRGRFEADLARVVSEAERYHRRGGLIVLDLDGFKQVNDRFGHATGDELIGRVGGLLRGLVRETDVVARIGGDEFAVILHQARESETVAVAEKMIDALRVHGLVVHGRETARVTSSVGITTFDAEAGLTADELLVEADIAMYDAKAAGRDRHCVYDRRLNRRETISQRHSWLDQLRGSIERDTFVLHAQPITAIANSDIPRYELLLRMPGDDGELIMPSTFLYNAERFDLMGTIDRWVLRAAIRLLHDHSCAGNDISLAVNLSGNTMNDLALSSDLAAMLDEHPIPDGRLIIEITETAAIVNIDRARQLARELRGLGCRFALDDFGAGFASFYYLKHLEFDYLKIDGEFISELVDTPTDQLVVQAVVDIARGLNTQTVAEFVGDQDTVELLGDLGVDYGQGFHLGRPGPLEERLPALVG